MSSFALPPHAVPAATPRTVHLQIVSPSAEPPDGDGWLHEVKHDGHRLVAILAGGDLKLISRNGYDRTDLFREPFAGLTGLPPLVLDGEIAVPDARGLRRAVRRTAPAPRRPARLFRLRPPPPRRPRPACVCARRQEGVAARRGRRDRPAASRRGRSPGRRRPQLFATARRLGADGIVSKRAGSAYRGGASRDWLKTKVSETGAFVIVITGYIAREAVAVAELRDGVLVPAGLVKFGLAGKALWQRLAGLRAGPSSRSGKIPVRPELLAEVKYFGRYRAGWIRDGVLLRVADAALSSDSF